MAARDPQYLTMDNSSAHSRHSEASLLQQLYHVIPEPTIHHQEHKDNNPNASDDNIHIDCLQHE